MIKKLLILSLSVALIFAAAGVDVSCNSTTDSKGCGSAGASTWSAGTAASKFKVTDCSTVGSTFTNIYDTFCTSCPQGGNSNTFANAAQTGCATTAASVGANVACQASSACTGCGDLQGFSWTKAGDTTNCIIASCLAAPLPSTGLTDNFCGSCGKTNKFANSYGSACVAPTGGNCSRKTGWTDADCSICNANGANSGKIKASSDKTSCVTSSSSIIVAILSLIAFALLF